MRYFGALFILIFCGDVHFAAGHMFLQVSHTLKTDTDTVVHKQSVSLGSNYGTDASFFGRTGPVKYPYFTSDVIYNSKPGLFAYATAWKVIGSIPVFDELDLGGGYAYTPSNKFSGSISYTHFFFNKFAEVIQSSSSNDVNFNNAYDFKLIKASVTLDYLFGQSNDFFTTVGISHYFETNWSIFDDKDYLSFNPGASMIVGTQNFVSKYAEDHYFNLDFQNIFLRNQPGAPDYEGRNSELNVLNYSFKIPVAYNRPHWTLEAAWKYSLPVNVEGPLHNHRELFFNMTFYYLFF
jgi:hypothetical protein